LVDENQTEGYESWFSKEILVDETAPTNPAISVNGDATYSNTVNVILKLSADDGGGVTGYFVSEDSNTPSTNHSGWVSVESAADYIADEPFTLSSGDGGKTVYVWYKDFIGNISQSAFDSIILDTAAPTGSVVINYQ
jgi:hypothetical protein